LYYDLELKGTATPREVTAKNDIFGAEPLDLAICHVVEIFGLMIHNDPTFKYEFILDHNTAQISLNAGLQPFLVHNILAMAHQQKFLEILSTLVLGFNTKEYILDCAFLEHAVVGQRTTGTKLFLITNQAFYMSVAEFDDEFVAQISAGNISRSQIEALNIQLNRHEFSKIAALYKTHTGQLFCIKMEADSKLGEVRFIKQAFAHYVIGVVDRLVDLLSRLIRNITYTDILPIIETHFSTRAPKLLARNHPQGTLGDFHLVLQTLVTVETRNGFIKKCLFWFEKEDQNHLVIADYHLHHWQATKPRKEEKAEETKQEEKYPLFSRAVYQDIKDIDEGGCLFLLSARRGHLHLQFKDERNFPTFKVEINFPCETSRKMWRRKFMLLPDQLLEFVPSSVTQNSQGNRVPIHFVL
jgi:hypothetical protein